ncbi:hypothetical protein [Cupriavidus pinatubonensis]|uniref:Uncharacterized protein n=1 Tax=Cupriavidus pinatubonensis TaxID=248026 RepID=A0ABM8XK82_9BURK|nr:hypothetical protein [Cupriavidus pinatubonensis]CAG9180630.1 hypothetical protein LMG23994_04463 [Cupriavidus pinatubonensis]
MPDQNMHNRLQNSTFHGDEPTWANACVGNNGSPGIIDYAEGFADAATALLDQVLADHFRHSTDTFIYPICFNMRHAAELYLKAAIQSLHSFGDRSLRLPRFDMDGSHDIGLIWAYFSEYAVSIDRRYRGVIEELEGGISDIASVDPNGQVFRYPFGRENNKHLEEISIINCRVLKERFVEIRKKLGELGKLSAELEFEYSLGSYTERLSRFDLLCIAHMLPARTEWGSVAFDEAKYKVRNLFAISSNEFSKALHRIQGNREMACLIGAPVPLDFCGPEQLSVFFDAWFKLNDREEIVEWLSSGPHEIREIPTDLGQELFAGLERRTKAQAEAWDSVSKELSLEAIGEIDALFNFYRSLHAYGEEFERERAALTRHLETMFKSGESNYRDSVMNLVEKVNVFREVLNSLNFFGYNELVQLLLDRYELSAYTDRLLEESKRRMEWRNAIIKETICTYSVAAA